MRRRVGEEYSPDCVVRTVKHGGGNIMVWGCMTMAGVGNVYKCEGRMNSQTYVQMLEEVLKPSIEKLFKGSRRPLYFFQQDNAPCHTAKATMSFFSRRRITLLEWPAQSPDLNPIENLWQKLKENVHKRSPTSKHDLYQKIQEEWEKIPTDYCAKVVESMPKRINAVIKAKGGPTKY